MLYKTVQHFFFLNSNIFFNKLKCSLLITPVKLHAPTGVPYNTRMHMYWTRIYITRAFPHYTIIRTVSFSMAIFRKYSSHHFIISYSKWNYQNIIYLWTITNMLLYRWPVCHFHTITYRKVVLKYTLIYTWTTATGNF